MPDFTYPARGFLLAFDAQPSEAELFNAILEVFDYAAKRNSAGAAKEASGADMFIVFELSPALMCVSPAVIYVCI